VFQSKPILILRTLSGAELRLFGEWLEAPLHNRSEALRSAFAILAEGHPDYAAPWLERRELHAHLWPGEAWDEKRLRYLFSDLAKALERFLVWITFREQAFEQDRLLLRAFARRGLDKYYAATRRQVEQRMESHPWRDAEYLGMRFLLEKMDFEHRSTRKSHQLDTNLQQVVDGLDTWFLANKLKFSCEILNNRGVLNVAYELFLLDEILGHLKDRDFTRQPVIACYAQVLLTLTEPDEPAHYRRLLDLLEMHRDRFPPQEVFDLYVYAKNYCIVRINKGQVEYTRELFDFYNIILDQGIILRDGRLTQWDFKNLVTLGLRLGELAWTEDFMDRFQDDLLPEERDNVLAYNRSNVAFYRGRYGETLERLQEVAFTDPYYHLDAKALLLKTYYEAGEWEALGALIEAFQVYLKRNKQISDYQVKVFGNLVRHTKALVRFRRGRNVDLDALSKTVEETREIANIAWLREKLAEARAGA
jgi:tetratricopeptide (TPR) repeat protein